MAQRRVRGSEVVTDEILELVPEQFREGVIDGSLIVKDRKLWYDKLKPVLVDTKGRIKSGRYISNDPTVISRTTAYKRKRGFREMRDLFVPATSGETAQAITSLEEIVKSLWEAVNGSPQQIECPCGCEYKGLYAFKKDPNALFRWYENIVGKATETQDINISNTHLIALLNDTTPIETMEVIDISPSEAFERRKLLGEGFNGGDYS